MTHGERLAAIAVFVLVMSAPCTSASLLTPWDGWNFTQTSNIACTLPVVRRVGRLVDN